MTALSTLQDAHRILLAALGPGHDELQRALAWLRRAEGRAMQAVGRSADAALKLEESMRLFESDAHCGPEHVRTKAVAADLACCRAA